MIYRSQFPDVEIPRQSLGSFVLGQAGTFGDRVAIVDGAVGRGYTYNELCAHSRRVAAGLQARGFGRGDVFGLFCPNVPEFALAFYGVALAGGVNTTANPLYTAPELAFQLKDAGAKFLLTVPACLETAREAARMAGVEEVFVLGEGEGATPFAALLDNDGSFTEPEIDPGEDLVVLPYSSGTTGKPKGVMLTHHNLVANISQTRDLDDVGDHEVLIGVLPFFHIYGMTVILGSALHRGSTIVSLPRFDLEAFLAAIQEYKVTIAYLVPPIVLALAKHPLVDRYDLSSLKFINSGAAPLGEDLAATCRERVGCVIKQGYGMTETSPVTHTTPYGGRVKVESVGVIIPNTECRIVDPATGSDVEEGGTGEILVRGPQVMKGYLNRPDATAEAVDDEGWLHTGDIGWADSEGYFRVVDRLKEFIKYKGYQVAPAELEDHLMSHPAVEDAAVIPRPDEEAGEIPKAFVVLKGEATAQDVMSYIAERVAPHKKIRHVEFVDEIPKSASGKILRRVLIEQERERVAGGA